MPCDFVLTSKLLVKAKKTMLEKKYFQRGFEFLKNVTFVKKEKNGVSKTKNSLENVTDICDLHLWTLFRNFFSFCEGIAVKESSG